MKAKAQSTLEYIILITAVTGLIILIAGVKKGKEVEGVFYPDISNQGPAYQALSNSVAGAQKAIENAADKIADTYTVKGS